VRDPRRDLDTIRAWLGNYEVPGGQVPLLDRPQIVVLNKIDVPEDEELAEFVRADIEALGYRVFEVSTVARRGLRELTYALGEIVERSEEHTSELQSRENLVCRLLLEKKKQQC